MRLNYTLAVWCVLCFISFTVSTGYINLLFTVTYSYILGSNNSLSLSFDPHTLARPWGSVFCFTCIKRYLFLVTFFNTLNWFAHTYQRILLIEEGAY